MQEMWGSRFEDIVGMKIRRTAWEINTQNAVPRVSAGPFRGKPSCVPFLQFPDDAT